jgi:predicted nucleic acid-binding protein
MSVLDASVVLKWFVQEEDNIKADLIRQKHIEGADQIVVPDLLLYEVANALRFHPDFSSREIKQAIDTLFDIELEIITPTSSLLSKAIDIAKGQNVSCYDAAYLALAEELHSIFITADQKFVGRLSDRYKSICTLLRAYESEP